MKNILILLLIGTNLINAKTIEQQNTQNISNHLDMTLLMIATANNDLESMRQLIADGANVNAVCDRDFPHGGFPVLRFAIDNNSVEAMQLLIQAGANINDFTECPLLHPERVHASARNFSLLSYAIKQHAWHPIIQMLIDAGAQIDEKSIMNHWTPLMVAAFYGNTQAAISLMNAGADCTQINSYDGNRTALDYALEMDHQDIVTLLCNAIHSDN